MSDSEGYIYFGFGLGVYLFVTGFLSLKKKRLIENIPTSKIRSMAMGLVEINGEVVPVEKQILKSPFTNHDCVYYSYTIEEYRSSGKRSRWVTVKKGEDGFPFILRDETGCVLVDPKGAQVDVPADFECSSGLGCDPPQDVQTFLKSVNMNFEGWLGTNKKMRYKEYYLAPNDRLYVMGTADDNPFIEEGQAGPGVLDIMICKGKVEKFYYISDRPEYEILNKLKWKVIGGIFGGAALTIFCLYFILIDFGLF